MPARHAFDGVVDAYDDGRPSYPDGVYDALGALRGSVVLDVGAGTGIATRQLLERGARVVALDRGPTILGRAARRTPGLPCVVADGSILPVRAGSVDLVCCAQSWHWLADPDRVGECHRVLTPGGRWAGWWSHARADGEPWFDSWWALVETACPGVSRDQRDTDWGSSVIASGRFRSDQHVRVPWTRTVSASGWIIDHASHTYVAALDPDARADLMTALRSVVDDAFPGGTMHVPYETWLWTAVAS